MLANVPVPQRQFQDLAYVSGPLLLLFITGTGVTLGTSD
jgi:hypothetical protein